MTADIVDPAGGPDDQGQLRSDARRNRARVLDIALETFATEGMSVTLGDIARRAGVGAGTVYRHFPTKEKLFEEVLARRTDELVEWGRELTRGDSDPAQRFFAFFAHTVSRATVNRALCDGFHAITGRRTELSADLFDGYLTILGELLAAAQAAGAVRSDVNTADVHALIAGAAAIESTRAAADNDDWHLTRIILDGLRTDETKQIGFVVFGDDLADARHETTHACAECGKPIHAAHTGRPARFCGAACRQKAHRRKLPRRLIPAGSTTPGSAEPAR